MARSTGIVSIPATGGEAGLNRYLSEIKKFPILAPEEEYMLAKRWREHNDTEAAAKLVNSHLRLVAKIAIVEGVRGKRAVTHWTRLQVLRDAAMVECGLETGRTHQVRVHMASIGHPLLGDPVYGRGKSTHRQLLGDLGFHRQALHAARLGFTHPVTKARLSFASALPSDMQELFTALGV